MELAQSSLGEQFLRFSKHDLSWFNRIFSFLMRENLVVFQIFLLRSIKAYLCPNIINFDGVDFSGRRPEKVISFFWRSVYINEWFMLVCSMYNNNINIIDLCTYNIHQTLSQHNCLWVCVHHNIIYIPNDIPVYLSLIIVFSNGFSEVSF